MLKVDKINSGYGKKQVLYDVSLNVQHREIVTLIGPNGSGKSTVLKVIHGIIPAWDGNVHFENQILDGTMPAERVQKGIVFVPQGNKVFSEMSVRENLELGGVGLSKKEIAERILDLAGLFPAIQNRFNHKAGVLSGGEQQMVSVARALMSNPKLIMLDEPSLGLSPKLVKIIFEKILEINEKKSVTVLIVEQNVRECLSISNRVYSLKMGRVCYQGDSSGLAGDKDLLKNLFL